MPVGYLTGNGAAKTLFLARCCHQHILYSLIRQIMERK